MKKRNKPDLQQQRAVNIFDRQLPHNIEAERAVLGAALVNPKAMLQIETLVSEDDFFEPRHKRIFSGLRAMVAFSQNPDLVILGEQLQRSGALEEVGGYPYLSGLMDGVPVVTNFPQYAEIIRQDAMYRRLIGACHAMALEAFDREMSPANMIERGTEKLLQMMSRTGNALYSTWKEATEGAAEQIIGAIKNPESVMRLLSGVDDLDEFTAGFRRQELVIIAAPPGHGKSTVAMQVAIQADTAGYRGNVFSAEMSKELLAQRELAHAADVPMHYFRRPQHVKDKQDVIDRIMKATHAERNRKLWVIDEDIRPEKMWALCKLRKQSEGLDFAIADYDQLIVRAGGVKRGQDKFDAQADFMRDSKLLAKKLDICVVVLCQPSKMDEELAKGKRAPRLDDLFGSTAVGNNADLVLWFMRKFFTSGLNKAYVRNATVYGLKARNDYGGKMKVGFDPDRVLYTDAPPDEENSTEEKPEPKRKRGKSAASEQGEF